MIYRLTILLALIGITTVTAEEFYCPPGPCNPCDTFWGRIDYLYWKPCVDGLSVALNRDEGQKEVTQLGVPFGESEALVFAQKGRQIDESIKFPSDDWDSGFRLGVGYHTGDSGCDYTLNWVYYNPTITTKVKLVDPCHTLIPFNGLSLQEELVGIEVIFPTKNGGSEYISGDPVLKGCTDINAFQVEAKWELDLNMVDFEKYASNPMRGPNPENSFL